MKLALHTGTLDLMKLTSKELCNAIGIARDTIKHWRYGYYTDPVKGRVFYREDKTGVPCVLRQTKAFNYYVYDLREVYQWIQSWSTESQKKNSLVKKMAEMLEE